MIGLGSNRLSVCRRGGMSVTQAGRGGMEWLAGGRMPSWASPYSAKATAALKAQFPTQWPTIRDYGFAHPEYIAAINFAAPQDPEIMYSLIPSLGKTRWIRGHLDAIIQTNLSVIADVSQAECVAKFYEYNNTGHFVIDAGTYPSRLCIAAWDRAVYTCNGNRQDYSTSTAAYTDNVPFKCRVINNATTKAVFVNDTQIFLNTQTEVYNYTANTKLKLITNASNTDVQYIKLFAPDDTLVSHFIPCKIKDNGVEKAGVLDMVTVTWYGNANSSGSFTISETPAS